MHYFSCRRFVNWLVVIGESPEVKGFKCSDVMDDTLIMEDDIVNGLISWSVKTFILTKVWKKIYVDQENREYKPE